MWDSNEPKSTFACSRRNCLADVDRHCMSAVAIRLGNLMIGFKTTRVVEGIDSRANEGFGRERNHLPTEQGIDHIRTEVLLASGL